MNNFLIFYFKTAIDFIKKYVITILINKNKLSGDDFLW